MSTGTETLLIPDAQLDESEKVAARMEAFIERTVPPPKEGDLATGTVISKDSRHVYIDLGAFGTGIIYGREYLNARDVIKKVNLSDTVVAKIIDVENEDGYIELSLREAKQAVIWGDAEAAVKEKMFFELPVLEANKGGLILEWQGISGFLPASQLKPEHYPRVGDGDKDKIFEELRKLVGVKLNVSIITADPGEGKLIFSEKNGDVVGKQRLIEKYHVGDRVEGEVTGAVDFGVFVKIEEGLEGLVHISEIDWSLVENPRTLYRVGDHVEAKIIEIKDDKISLSIKALKENPWGMAESRYQKGDHVKGVVIKYNRYGALVSIEAGVAGLIHISEFASAEKLQQFLELGKTYEFTITLFEPKDQRMTLVLVK